MPALLPIRRRLIPKFGRTQKRQSPALAMTTTSHPATTEGTHRKSSRLLRSSGAAFHRREPPVVGVALDVALTGLKIGEAVSSLAPGVPAVQVSLKVASTIVEVAQAMRSNKEDCRALATQVQGHMDVLSECVTESITLSETDLYSLQILQDQLDTTLEILRGIACQTFIKRLCCHQRNKRSIIGCKEDLAAAFDRCNLRNQISHSKRLEHMLQAIEAVPVRTGRIVAGFFF